VLLREDFPNYFQHLLEETVIRAPRAREYYQTRDLKEAYFEPMGVISLLDFILHDGAVPLGVICSESRTRERQWSDADVNYLRALTALASRFFKVNPDIGASI